MKKISDARMDTLFRSAVIKIHGRVCAICGQYHSNAQVHHIIKRRCLFLRWDVRNGAVVCPACHTSDVHGHGYDQYLLDTASNSKFLKEASKVSVSEVLRAIGKTRNEFKAERKAILEVILGVKHG